MTMNINLSPQLESMVREKVSAGLYTSASEVVREALQLMQEKDEVRATRLGELRQEIKAGLDSGPSSPLNMREVVAEGQRRRAARGRDDKKS